MSSYLDHAATTPMRDVAREAYLDAVGLTGNPASVHAHGQAARRRLEESRERLAAGLGCEPIELILTSGGTESVNLAVKGMFWARNGAVGTATARPRPGIVLSAAEHHATLDAVAWLERLQGASARYAEVDADGVLHADALAAALGDGDDVALVTSLVVNNEVGAVQPVRELARTAREGGVPMHLDAVAALGHLDLDFAALGVEAMSVSAHKIGGPVGVGALVVSRAARLEPLLHGGGQQRGLRSGTQDVAGAAAFAAALDESLRDAADERSRLLDLRNRLIAGLTRIDGVTLRGPAPDASLVDGDAVVPARSPSNVHVTIEGVVGETLLFLLDVIGVSVSTGSACQAGVTEPSHVVRAMGFDVDTARGALRCSLGTATRTADLERFLAAAPDAIARARAASATS